AVEQRLDVEVGHRHAQGQLPGELLAGVVKSDEVRVARQLLQRHDVVQQRVTPSPALREFLRISQKERVGGGQREVIRVEPPGIQWISEQRLVDRGCVEKLQRFAKLSRGENGVQLVRHALRSD